MRNIEWVSLSDSERGQLIAIWLLAADHNGVIPASSEIIQKLCFMTKAPNLTKFTELGFLESDGCQSDVNLTPDRRQLDPPEAETEAETEKNRIPPTVVVTNDETSFLTIPLKSGSGFVVTENKVKEWEELFPGLDVRQCLRDCKAWNTENRERRKTQSGIRKHVVRWLTKANDRGEHNKGNTHGKPFLHNRDDNVFFKLPVSRQTEKPS